MTMRESTMPAWSRREWIVRSLAATSPAMMFGACASRNFAGRIVDVATGGALTGDDVIARVRPADVVLLGELHDNPHHHEQRARMLDAIGMPVTVVAEHLPRSAAPVLAPAASGDALRQSLEAAGFDAKGWRWPVHEPVFAAVARAGHVLRGGNLDRDTARRIAREGIGAMPADLRPWVDAAPLTTDARATLERDLLASHCGHLGAERTQPMVWSQRGRDAAMAAALVAAHDRPASAGPVILLAGNGHVRVDYGVPQLLRALRPALRLLSIGFVESDAQAARAPYDIAWVTLPAKRGDPCATFDAPRPASR